MQLGDDRDIGHAQCCACDEAIRPHETQQGVQATPHVRLHFCRKVAPDTLAIEIFICSFERLLRGAAAKLRWEARGSAAAPDVPLPTHGRSLSNLRAARHRVPARVACETRKVWAEDAGGPVLEVGLA